MEKMKDIKELIQLVEDWAQEKGIFDKATPIKQAMKTQEELTELLNAILNDDKFEIKDERKGMRDLKVEGNLDNEYDLKVKGEGNF